MQRVKIALLLRPSQGPQCKYIFGVATSRFFTYGPFSCSVFSCSRKCEHLSRTFNFLSMFYKGITSNAIALSGNVILQSYFHKKKARAMSIASCGGPVGMYYSSILYFPNLIMPVWVAIVY